MAALTTQNKNNIAYYAWLIFFLATLTIYYIAFKQHGIEIQVDSSAYIRGALSMKEGLGFTHSGELINHFPAGMSFIYFVLMTIFSASIYTVALYLNVVLLACIGILFKRLMQQLNMAEPVQFASFIIFIFSPPVIDMSSKMMTELPTTFLIMLSTVLLLRKKNTWTNILLIGITLGIGILIRFAMIGVIAGFAAYLFWINRQSIKRAFMYAILVFIPGILISVSYSIYTKWQYHNVAVDRKLIWHPITPKLLSNFIKTPFSWIVQYKYNEPTQVIILGLLTLIISIALWLNTYKPERSGATLFNRIKKNNALMTIIVIPVIYCLFIATSISLFDETTPVDTRILSVISVFFYLGLSYLLQVWYNWSSNIKKSAVLLFFLALVLVWPAQKTLSNRYNYPQAFNKPYWQIEARSIVNETAFKWTKPNCKIYTNSLSFWHICNNKKVIRLPYALSDASQNEKNKFLEKMTLIRNEIINNQAQLIFFASMPANHTKSKIEFFNTFFADTNLFNRIPFNKGVIIEASTNR